MRNEYVCFMLFILHVTFGANVYQNGERLVQRRPKPDPRISSISRLLMGAPNVVVNIEHLNVDRPNELNINIAQKPGFNNNTSVENIVEKNDNNETKSAGRPNDKFLKNFYNESLSKVEREKESILPKYERKNITYFIHKLLNKRDSSYKSKIAHFKIQPNSAEPNRIGKELHFKVNTTLPMDSNMNEILEKISNLQQKELDKSQYGKGLYEGPSKNITNETKSIKSEQPYQSQVRNIILTIDDEFTLENQRTSMNINSLLDMQPFQPLKIAQLENEEVKNKTLSGISPNETQDIETINDTDTHEKYLENDQTIDTDRTNDNKNNTNMTTVHMTNNCTTKINNKTNCNPRQLNNKLNKTNDKMKEDKNTGKIYKSGKDITITDLQLISPCTRDNSTNSLRQLENNIDTEREYDCETAKDFVKENCDETESDTIQQKEDQHLQDISQFFQFHHNNQTVGIRNATAEECCNGNHILDILKMLNRILPSERRFPFFQSRQLKTHKESWLFRINKQQVVLTNSEISRIIRKGFESYHNHIDGFELFECKIFGRCQEEVNNTEKNEERKKTRKEKRQQQKKWKQFRNQNP